MGVGRQVTARTQRQWEGAQAPAALPPEKKVTEQSLTPLLKKKPQNVPHEMNKRTKVRARENAWLAKHEELSLIPCKTAKHATCVWTAPFQRHQRLTSGLNGHAHV